ncbi:MAG: D-alanine--D-alanine ligase family protein [Eubacteriales bacterium]|jgi:D-alanine-D-alanine ligase
MTKRKVCILFGGQSSEHSVSCVSASYVTENLNSEMYEVYRIGITRQGKWMLYEGSTEDMRSGAWEQHPGNCPAVITPDATLHGITLLGPDGVRTIPLDVVFPVLHGLYGEDGTVQGLLELARIPYVGPHVLASATAMDKVTAKILFAAAGLHQAKWVWFPAHWLRQHGEEAIGQVENAFPYPVYVKPANAGSSIGITKAENRQQLAEAFEEAMRHDSRIVVEETIVGRELECAVLGNEEPIASPVGEVLPSVDFYDFDAKYNSDVPNTQVPAQLDEETSRRLREEAVRAYRTLNCVGLSRVDFFLQPDGTIILNEINTLPGFTAISMYPQLFAVSGLPYGKLLDELIRYALED